MGRDRRRSRQGGGSGMSTSRARELRNSMSPPEVLLWSRLKRLRAQGFHFRRQTPFRGYYLDFVCFSRRLVVEVDGGQHAEDEAARHDAVRDAVLRREGFQVMRFWAGTVMGQPSEVMDAIADALARRPAQRAPP